MADLNKGQATPEQQVAVESSKVALLIASAQWAKRLQRFKHVGDVSRVVQLA